jgi:hypothetical protein
MGLKAGQDVDYANCHAKEVVAIRLRIYSKG